jgi:hypothetical protein
MELFQRLGAEPQKAVPARVAQKLHRRKEMRVGKLNAPAVPEAEDQEHSLWRWLRSNLFLIQQRSRTAFEAMWFVEGAWLVI